MALIDLTGQRFTKLVVKFLHPTRRSAHGGAMWVCVCDCGKEKVVGSQALRMRGTKSCGCYRRERGPRVCKLKPFEALYKVLLRRCEREQKFCNLTFDEFLTFVEIKNCFYCNDVLQWSEFSLRNDKYKNCVNLDRFVNDKGYTKENCVVCCVVCNELKGCLDYTYFINRCKKIIEHRSKNG